MTHLHGLDFLKYNLNYSDDLYAVLRNYLLLGIANYRQFF